MHGDIKKKFIIRTWIEFHNVWFSMANMWLIVWKFCVTIRQCGTFMQV